MSDSEAQRSGVQATDAHAVEAQPVAQPMPVEAGASDAGPAEAVSVEVRPLEAGPIEAGPLEAREAEARPLEEQAIEADEWQPPPQKTGDRLLLIAAIASVAAHLLPFVVMVGLAAFGLAGAGASEDEHRLGDEQGKLDGVNVEIIDAQEYDRRYMSHTAGSGTGNQDAAPAVPTPPPQPEPVAKPEPETKPAEVSPETPPPTPEDVPVEKPEDDALQPAKPQQQAKLEEKPQPKPEPKRQRPQKPDDVLTPAEAEQLIRSAQSEFQSIAEASSKASVAAYGTASPAVRAILRKLKSGMPRSPGVRGSLVVRIVLSENGGVAALGLVSSSGKPDLDKRVLDSVRSVLTGDPATHIAPKERQLQITYDYF